MNEASSMKPACPRVLTINGGSSSIKFALFEANGSLRRILEGGIERIGLPGAIPVCFMKGAAGECEPSNSLRPSAVHHFGRPFRADEIVRVVCNLANEPICG
jgi:acetate kinase